MIPIYSQLIIYCVIIDKTAREDSDVRKTQEKIRREIR